MNKLIPPYFLLIIVMFAVFAVSYFLVINEFFDYFKCIKDCRPTTQADWGQLGDYVGGLLNPAFAGLTLIFVTYTSYIQSKYINDEREQIRIERNNSLRNEKAHHLEKAIQNLRSSFDKDIAFFITVQHGTSGYGKVRDELVKLWQYCMDQYYNDESDLFSFVWYLIKKDEVITGKVKRIRDSSKLLLTHAVIIEALFHQDENFEVFLDQRISIIASAFDSSEEMAGFLIFLLINQYIYDEINQSKFNKTVNNISVLLDVSDPFYTRLIDEMKSSIM